MTDYEVPDRCGVCSQPYSTHDDGEHDAVVRTRAIRSELMRREHERQKRSPKAAAPEGPGGDLGIARQPPSDGAKASE